MIDGQYVVSDYVESNYVEGDITNPEYVKVVGFSKTVVIEPTVEDPTDEIMRNHSRKAYRKAFAFPDQQIVG